MKVLMMLCLLVCGLLFAPSSARSGIEGFRSLSGTVSLAKYSADAGAFVPARPVSSAYVTLFLTSPAKHKRAIEGQWTDKNGMYRFYMLDAGIYELTVRGPSLQRRSVIVDLRNPESPEVERDVLLLASLGARRYPIKKVPIFFATDRAKAPSFSDGLFANDISEPITVSYGKLVVDVPDDPDHRFAPRPGSWQWLLQPFVGSSEVSSVEETSMQVLPKADFFAALTRRLSQFHQGDALVYIHGFKTSFANAACTAAELSFALKHFNGPTILYSWSSHFDWMKYNADEDNISVTRKSLRAFLEDLGAQPGVARINIIAHSLGNQALVDVLGSLHDEYEDDLKLGRARLKLGEVILAAPDVDELLYKEEATAMTDLAKRVTLYSSEHDSALAFSFNFLHDRYRTGNHEPPLTIKPVETIDASEASTNLTGHSYFIDDANITDDIDRAIMGEPPPRCHLSASNSVPLYWRYVVPSNNTCRQLTGSAQRFIDNVGAFSVELTTETEN